MAINGHTQCASGHTIRHTVRQHTNGESYESYENKSPRGLEQAARKKPAKELQLVQVDRRVVAGCKLTAHTHKRDGCAAVLKVREPRGPGIRKVFVAAAALLPDSSRF